MDPEIEITSFVLDPEISNIYQIIVKIPIYDENYNKIGFILCTNKSVFEIIDKKNEIFNIYNISDNTIYFYNTNNSVSFSQNILLKNNDPLFKPYSPIRSLITNCTGDIYNRTGTVETMEFDNKVKSTMITITLN
jgi:hypothetical protein